MASKDKNSFQRAEKRKDRNQRFQVRTQILGYYLIVTDTEETEKNYFEGLKRSIPEEITEGGASIIVLNIENFEKI